MYAIGMCANGTERVRPPNFFLGDFLIKTTYVLFYMGGSR